MSDKILLVDDEEEFMRTLARRLELRGVKVATAESGPAAIEKARAESFDAIILDVSMQPMDGIETLRLLRLEHPKLQVIFLTGYATVSRSVEAIKLGALDFLRKPADLAVLLEKIKEAKAKKMILSEEEKASAIEEILKNKAW